MQLNKKLHSDIWLNWLHYITAAKAMTKVNEDHQLHKITQINKKKIPHWCNIKKIYTAI